MRFLFVSAPLAGHLDWGGYLATAAALGQRGHQVTWASGEAVANPVTDAGVSFQALPVTGWRWPPPPPLAPDPALTDAEHRRLRQERALDQWLDVARVSQATDALLDLAAEVQPDVVVSELFIAAAGLVAERLDRPLVIAGWPAMEPVGPQQPSPLLAPAQQRLATLLERFAVAGRNWEQRHAVLLRSPHLHLTYWCPSWYAGARLQPQTRHVGGKAAPAQPPHPQVSPSPEAGPWVFITLGTAFNRDQNFFVTAAQAVVDLGGTPVVALGRPAEDDFARQVQAALPPEAQLFDRVDFRAVLPYCSAAIHHGGAGTTHAVVLHGLPQIVVPHAADQQRQAHSVARTAVGYHIAPAQFHLQNAINALSQLLPDRSPHRANADALRTEMALLGGVEQAAALLEKLGSGDAA